MGKMIETEALKMLNKLRDEGMTYFALSKLLDVPPGTILRWLREGKMNRLYAEHVQRVLSQHGTT